MRQVSTLRGPGTPVKRANQIPGTWKQLRRTPSRAWSYRSTSETTTHEIPRGSSPTNHTAGGILGARFPRRRPEHQTGGGWGTGTRPGPRPQGRAPDRCQQGPWWAPAGLLRPGRGVSRAARARLRRCLASPCWTSRRPSAAVPSRHLGALPSARPRDRPASPLRTKGRPGSARSRPRHLRRPLLGPAGRPCRRRGGAGGRRGTRSGPGRASRRWGAGDG